VAETLIATNILVHAHDPGEMQFVNTLDAAFDLDVWI
jgi:hypothetical protein